MRNRAKCKKCKAIIESLTVTDYVECPCGEIAIEGGLSALRSYANDYANFLRVDDLNNEILTKYVADPEKPDEGHSPEDDSSHGKQPEKLTKFDKLEMLRRCTAFYEELLPKARYEPISHQDLHAVLGLLVSLFEELCADRNIPIRPSNI
jgi:hypothetical protein